MTPEGKVKQEVDAILKRNKVWYFKPVSAGYGTHGIPDYICCVAGWFLAIECKGRDDQKPTPLQIAVLTHISEALGTSIVVTPGNLNVLEHVIMTLLRRQL